MRILAIALNNTLTAVESGDINGTGCEGVRGSLVPLEEFSYSNEKMGCVIQWNLQQTNFSGVSVGCCDACVHAQALCWGLRVVRQGSPPPPPPPPPQRLNLPPKHFDKETI